MFLKFFPFAIAFLLISCTDFQRDNPYDPYGINYIGPPYESSSSSYEPSSSSSVPTITYGTSVPYEGETYETVEIGSQTWMARNLNYDVEGSKCYANDEANCVIYGRLYNWATAKIVCPVGWHLPSIADWNKLMRYVDGTNGTSSPYNSPTAGRYLRATSGWISNGGQDTYGFSALPGGCGNSWGGFNNVGYEGCWWSANDFGSSSSNAYYIDMGYTDERASFSGLNKNYLFSVRCVQD